MGIEKGLLVQPYSSVIFGDINLTAYPGASGEKERLAQRLSLSYSKTEEAPSAEFEIVASVDGFEAVGLIRSSPELLKQVVEVEIGYPHLPEPKLKSLFLFSGINFTTGQDPSLKLTLTSAVKSAWTDNKINATMEEEMPLSEYPAYLQQLAGKGASLIQFKFVGQAAIDAPDIMIKKNSVNQTAQNILAEVLAEHGMELRVGDTALDGTMVIGYNAGKEGEMEQDKCVLDGKPEAGKRSIHILGPGLLENAQRSQKFTLGQSDKKGGKKSKATSATETENKKSKNPKSIAETAAAESTGTGVKTDGPTDKAQARSGTTKDKPSEKEKARLAIADELKMELTANFPMVPQVVGMKPGDILAIPSLKGPGDWVEDYEIDEVKYAQGDTGEVMMSIKASKPWVGTDNLMDPASVALVQARVRTLQTPDAWSAYYWRQGPDLAWPLAG